MMKLRIGFMGTPDFALEALKALHQSGHDIVCVYSQPPRPKGRGHKVQLSSVHKFAEEQNIPVHTPVNFKDDDAAETFKSYNLDVAIVAAYGLILPQHILDAPKHGCINIHASLLPRWRGAAPIQRAILAGDQETGICLMQMEAGLDTGPVLTQQSCVIDETKNAQCLHDELAAMGADMIVKLVNQIASNQTPDTKIQDDANATYAKMLRKEEGLIDWSKDSLCIHRQVRGLNPWPGTWTVNGGERLKIICASAGDSQTIEEAGVVINNNGDIACGDGATMTLKTVQPAGKKPMPFNAALNGGYLKVGDKLG